MTFSLILSAIVPTFGAMLALTFFQGLGLGMSYSLLNVEMLLFFSGFVPGKYSFIPTSLFAHPPNRKEYLILYRLDTNGGGISKPCNRF